MLRKHVNKCLLIKECVLLSPLFLSSGTLRQYDATGRCFICSGCLWSASGHEGADAASDDGPADGAVAQAGGAVATHHQVTAGDEYDGHQLVHADFTGPLLLQLPQQLLWAGLIDCDRVGVGEGSAQAQVKMMNV